MCIAPTINVDFEEAYTSINKVQHPAYRRRVTKTTDLRTKTIHTSKMKESEEYILKVQQKKLTK